MNRVDAVLNFFFGPRKVPTHRQAPPPSALDAVCTQYGCRYERSVFPTGEVQLMLIRPDASLSAVGPSTADAVAKVVEKAHKCWSAL